MSAEAGRASAVAGEGGGALESIPMPAEPAPQLDAWRKAQEALSKIQQPAVAPAPRLPVPPPMPLNNIQAGMMQLYPWMPQCNASAYPYRPPPPASWPPPTTSASSEGQSAYERLARPRPAAADWHKSQPAPAAALGATQNRASLWTKAGPLQRLSAVSSSNCPPRLPPPGLVTSPQLGVQTAAAAAAVPPIRMRFGIGRPRPTLGRAMRMPMGTGANQEPVASRSPAAAAAATQPSPTRPVAPAQQTMPDGLTLYIERAYIAAQTEADKNKVELVLKLKLMPLLHAGTAWKIDWAAEPLPTDPSFRMPSEDAWTPAAKLRQQQQPNAFNRTPDRAARRRWTDDEGGTPTSVARNNHKRVLRHDDGAAPFESSPANRVGGGKRRDISSSDSDVEIIAPVFQTKKQKKLNKKKFKTAKKDSKLKFSLDESVGAQAAMRVKRAHRFAAHHAAQPKVVASRLLRPQREDSDDLYTLSYSPAPLNDGEVDLSQFNIVGTSTEIEKPYLRLTAAPAPSQVRPVALLHKSLAHVKRRWKDTRDYRYACDQLKSIRQDLTIQVVRSSFTIDVYETHARLALEAADREEFNQCQSQLRLLYKELPGSLNEFEFAAYRLLYYILMENTMNMATLLADLSAEARRHPCVQLALRVRQAWSLRSYSRLFGLCQQAPRMSSYLLDLFIPRERKAALRTMIRAYRPHLTVAFISKQLNFVDHAECVEFLTTIGLPLLDGATKLDCRQCAAVVF